MSGRWRVTLLVVLGLLLGLFALSLGGAYTLAHCDGPVAESSTQGAWCAATVDTGWGLIPLFGLPLTLGLAVSVWSSLRWQERPVVRWVFPAVLAPALCIAATSVMFMAPSDRCSSEQRAAYQRWSDQPPRERPRQPPYYCQVEE